MRTRTDLNFVLVKRLTYILLDKSSTHNFGDVLSRKKARTRGKNSMPSATFLVIRPGVQCHQTSTVIMHMYVIKKGIYLP